MAVATCPVAKPSSCPRPSKAPKGRRAPAVVLSKQKLTPLKEDGAPSGEEAARRGAPQIPQASGALAEVSHAIEDIAVAGERPGMASADSGDTGPDMWSTWIREHVGEFECPAELVWRGDGEDMLDGESERLLNEFVCQVQAAYADTSGVRSRFVDVALMELLYKRSSTAAAPTSPTGAALVGAASRALRAPGGMSFE
mmetsp:Transcript_82433/g.238086  ORF Transcript_82433/g.238086 Transcript_82433/m.238086 type:complete len:198 (-) Transcript_82433:944-1537(-)